MTKHLYMLNSFAILMVAITQTPYRGHLVVAINELEDFLQRDPKAGKHILKAATFIESLPRISNDYKWKGILLPDSDLERAVAFLEKRGDDFWDNIAAVLSSASDFSFLEGRFTPPNVKADIEERVQYYLREGLLGKALGEYDTMIKAQWEKTLSIKKRTGGRYYAAPSEFKVIKEARQLAAKAGELCERYGYHSHALRFYEQAVYIQTLMPTLDPEQKCRRFSLKRLEAAQRAAELSNDARKRDIYERLAVSEQQEILSENNIWSDVWSNVMSFLDNMCRTRTDPRKTDPYSELRYELHLNPLTS
jgi:tetratricopeptide (TPR) repeat protein